MGNFFGPLIGGFWGGSLGIHSAFGLSGGIFLVALLLLGMWRPGWGPAAATTAVD